MRISIKSVKKTLLENEFTRSVATLATGTFLAQIIPLLLAPVVARLYIPADYALLAIYSSITILLTIVATGMYDAALMLDKNDEDAVNTGAAAVLITIVITLVAALATLFFRDEIAHFAGNENVRFWLYLVPLTVFCSGFYSTLNVWNNRKKRYKRLSSNRIIMALFTTSLTIGLGFFGCKEKGLLISSIVGQAIAFLLLFAQTIRNDKLLLSFINKTQIICSLKRHSDFPKYNMPQGFLDGIKESCTIWIIFNFFGAHVLGSFSFAKNILMRPLQIIGGAVSQVFYQKASSIYYETGNIYKISKNTFLILFVLGLPFALVLLFWGDNIFSFIFSSRWKEAGEFSQILIPWLFLSFVASSLGNIPLILKKQKNFFYWALLMNMLPISALYIAAKFNESISFALTTFSFSSIIMYTLIFLWLRHIVILNEPKYQEIHDNKGANK